MEDEDRDEREPYEAPELITLASVEDATLATPESTSSDGVLNASTF
jgi:hypothetical protein